MSQAGVASLKNALPPAGPIDTLTGNIGPAVIPVLGNINIVGAAGEITVTGTNAGPAATLLISLASQSGIFTTTTVGAVTNAMITIPIANPEGIMLNTTLIAVVNDYSSSAGGTFLTTVSNNGAGAVISGNTGSNLDGIPGGTVAFWGVSGNNAVFSVTGVAGLTINWKAYFNFLLI